MPYTLDANDMRFATPQGFNSGDQFFAYLSDSFDTLYAEGESAPKMMSIGLHCRLVGRPGRAAALARFLDYVQAHENVWIATRLDIARHWIKHHPPAGGYRPSGVPKGLFVEIFGRIWENAPWVAEDTYDAGITASHDDAATLHAAMVKVMRASTPERLKNLLLGHPDLAGKLAAAGEMTEESIGEQASAGLDRLSSDERVRFTALNEAYKARFGIPFIMAVAGASKEAILAAFETRLKSTPEAEFETALAQVETISLLRLKEIMRN